MSKEEEEYKFTIAVIGDQFVGKTSLLYKYLNKDELVKTTIGNTYEIKITSFDGKKVTINFIDTSGQDKFKAITKSIFHEADGFIIVFDLNNEITFDNILYWFYEIKNTIDIHDTEILMIGNKNDLERKVSLQRIHNFEKINNLGIEYLFHETSAKTGDGVDESISILIEKLIKHYEDNKKNNKIKPKNIKLGQNNNNEEKNKGGFCC
jgi:small GTP-binding protein